MYLVSRCHQGWPAGRPWRLASLRTALVRQPGSPDYLAPRSPTRWRSGWPCRRAEANSRLPQKRWAAAAFTPATVTRPHLEPRARKPAGMDAHCARQERRHQGWPAGRPWRLACVLAVDWTGALPPLHQRRDSRPTLWQPRMNSGLSPQPPDRLANKVGPSARESGLPDTALISTLAQWVAIPAG